MYVLYIYMYYMISTNIFFCTEQTNTEKLSYKRIHYMFMFTIYECVYIYVYVRAHTDTWHIGNVCVCIHYTLKSPFFLCMQSGI